MPWLSCPLDLEYHQRNAVQRRATVLGLAWPGANSLSHQRTGQPSTRQTADCPARDMPCSA
eukprot:363879-Chlamydomonas_euryale.AAC.5